MIMSPQTCCWGRLPASPLRQPLPLPRRRCHSSIVLLLLLGITQEPPQLPLQLLQAPPPTRGIYIPLLLSGKPVAAAHASLSSPSSLFSHLRCCHCERARPRPVSWHLGVLRAAEGGEAHQLLHLALHLRGVERGGGGAGGDGAAAIGGLVVRYASLDRVVKMGVFGQTYKSLG